MIIIADSGGTSTNWAIVNDGETVFSKTIGHNALSAADGSLASAVTTDAELSRLKDEPVECVYFYGAGCATPEANARVERELRSAFRGAKSVVVASDMLAAARALCGHEPGIACILGTGSNSCLFDGTDIVDNVSPLGFILGDEGSGAVIGRLFLGQLLKRMLPAEIAADFDREFHLSAADIITQVYRQPRPNAFLGSFAPFISAHKSHPAIQAFLVDEFRRFFRNNVEHYANHRHLPIHFVGSIALHFADELNVAASLEGLTVGDTLRDPLPRLVKYHLC